MNVNKVRARLGLDGPADAAARHAVIRSHRDPDVRPVMGKREAAAIARRFAPGWLRKQVLVRDGFRCRYCRRPVTDKTANMDHVKPWPFGMTEIDNLVACCRDCNRRKGRSESPHWQAKADRSA